MAQRSGFRPWYIAAAIFTLLLSAFMPATAGAVQSEPGRAVFASQAESLGLTKPEAQQLQARVDSYLSKLGGRQVAVNKIDLAGAEVLLALPGEKTARDVTTKSEPGLVCPELYFCAWSQMWFTGDKIFMYHCNNWYIPWVSTGSWMNNQTNGTVAYFLDDRGIARWHDQGAVDDDLDADWSWVHYVYNC
ncbi:peptidase inhibitor family I36 protein [Streptomyces graminifolii]|uniref:peptidase inhibitor family I36 protein n=1 Tax=Streptomyces graminifolii TaxID=1266771 RepID=UPI0040587B08